MYLTECRFYRESAEAGDPDAGGVRSDRRRVDRRLHAAHGGPAVARRTARARDRARDGRRGRRRPADARRAARAATGLTWTSRPCSRGSTRPSTARSCGSGVTRGPSSPAATSATTIAGEWWGTAMGPRRRRGRLRRVVAEIATRAADRAPRRAHVGNTSTCRTGTQVGSQEAGRSPDWQLCSAATGRVDVAYVVMTSLDPATRAVHERSLLRGYLDELDAQASTRRPATRSVDPYRANASGAS